MKTQNAKHTAYHANNPNGKCVGEYCQHVKYPKAFEQNITLSVLVETEEALGNSLHWIADKFDLEIRQKDPVTLEKLQCLNNAWSNCAVIIAKIKAGEIRITQSCKAIAKATGELK